MTSHPYDDLRPEDVRHPDSAKWTRYPDDVLPLWVADMDFPVAPAIMEALQARLARGIGYAAAPQLAAQITAHLAEGGLTDVPEDGLLFLPGVVPGLYASVLGLSSPGDEVVTVTPIYPPFLSAITDHGRVLRAAPLLATPDGWRLDPDALEAAVTPAARVLMLCHPHNPTGRVWSHDELEYLADFALRHRLWVVSDELHADLTLDGAHRAFAGVRPEVAERTITLTGPAKAYNTAGLGIGVAVSHNAALIARVRRAGAGVMGHPSALSYTAWSAALASGGEWLEDTRAYLRGNRDFLAAFLRERLPRVRFTPPQATYLAWLDLSAYGLEHPGQFLLEKARVGLNDGPSFGPELGGFVRLNFATSRGILAEALERMARALDEVEKNPSTQI